MKQITLLSIINFCTLLFFTFGLVSLSYVLVKTNETFLYIISFVAYLLCFIVIETGKKEHEVVVAGLLTAATYSTMIFYFYAINIIQSISF